MNFLSNKTWRLSVVLQFLISGYCSAAVTETEICVYGGTAAGVTAAVQAARLGKSVVLLEPGKHIGGMTSGGLGATDIGNKGVIGGLSREFYQRVAKHYASDAAWKWESRADYFALKSSRTKIEEVTGPDATMWTFEPHVADQILRQMLDEAKVPVRYELAARRAEKIAATETGPQIKQFCNPVWMPNGKTDINNSQGISTDFIGENYEYPDADYAKRAKIWAAHEDYVRGFWYFMSTSPRVPLSLRAEFQAFGPAKDEFPDTGGWPNQLYVREARRMVSDYVMTEHNRRSKVVAEDAVGMAAYGMDSHNCQRIVQNGVARNEGDVQEHGLKPYPVSCRSIIPKAAECENLLVPVCLSATHIAYGSIRMEPVFMVLGQSAATAAVMALEENSPVQEVNYQKLRSRLLVDQQVLALPPKPKTTKPSTNLLPERAYDH